MAIGQIIERVTQRVSDGGFEASTQIERQYETPASVVIESTVGGLTVIGTDRSDVAVSVDASATRQERLDDVTVGATGQKPLRLSVTDDSGDATDLDGSLRAETTVRLPADCRVESAEASVGGLTARGVEAGWLASDAGSIEATDLRAAQITTSAGSVTVASSDVDSVETAGGSVEAKELVGDTTIDTDAGEIDVDGVDGFLTASSAAGSITVRNAQGIDGLETNVGSIDATVNAIRSETAVESSAGGITVAAGPALAADVELSSTLGSVEGDGLAGSDGFLGGSAAGEVGGGGPRLTISTNSGGVDFRRVSGE